MCDIICICVNVCVCMCVCTFVYSIKSIDHAR